MNNLPQDGPPPALLALLHAVMNRIESKPFAERTRDIHLALDARSWPVFFEIAYPGERLYVWRALEALLVQPGVTLRLDQRRGYLDLDLWERSPTLVVSASAEPWLREMTQRMPSASDAWVAAWRVAVAERYGVSAVAARLMARPVLILERSPDEVLSRLDSIATLVGADLMLHEVASRQFWGLSKTLNGHAETLTLLLNLEACPFPERPVQLLVATRTAQPDAPILFVENAATFEALAAGRLLAADDHVLVFASGYKASARRLRQPGGCSVYFAPDVVRDGLALVDAFLAWLCSDDASRPVYFWGDLDFAGLDILRSLRGNIVQAQAWQPGYDALLDHLQAGESHGPEEAGKERQVDPGMTGCAYADEILLPALRQFGRFVDQESL